MNTTYTIVTQIHSKTVPKPDEVIVLKNLQTFSLHLYQKSNFNKKVTPAQVYSY